MIKNREITYKYDLMHLNTPKFASSVITWDTAKMGSITKNRVINALATGACKYSSGEASAMYGALRKRFELPEYVIRQTMRKDGSHQGYLYWDSADEGLLNALNTVYQAERVMVRLDHSMKNNNWMPYYLTRDTLDVRGGNFYLENQHDLTEVYANVSRLVSSPEVKARREEAIRFINEGGKFTFTFRGEPDGN